MIWQAEPILDRKRYCMFSVVLLSPDGPLPVPVAELNHPHDRCGWLVCCWSKNPLSSQGKSVTLWQSSNYCYITEHKYEKLDPYRRKADFFFFFFELIFNDLSSAVFSAVSSCGNKRAYPSQRLPHRALRGLHSQPQLAERCAATFLFTVYFHSIQRQLTVANTFSLNNPESEVSMHHHCFSPSFPFIIFNAPQY